MGTTAQKLEYLGTTKSQLKDMINYGLPTENQITNETTFRNYVKSIFEAFLESLRDSTTLYTNLPKISGNGTQITLNDTANAPMRITLKASELSQDATPTPDNPQDIHTISGDNSVVVEGKNLLPFTNQDFTLKNVRYHVQNGSLYLNGTSTGETSSISADFKNNFSFWLDAGTYIFSIKSGRATRLPTYILKYSDNSSLGAINGYNSSSATFTLNEKTQVYIGFYVYNQTFTNDSPELQLKKGSTATTYEPYVSQTAPINLDTIEYCKIGDYEDRIFKNVVGDVDYDSSRELGKWYLKKNIGKVVLDGNWNWYVQSTNHYQITMVPTSGAYKIYLAKSGVGLSNYFSVTAPSGTDISLYPILEAGGTDYIRIRNAVNQWSTLADFKTWLNNNNVEFYYPTSTPTYTQITGTLETQLNNIYKNMLSYKGTTNVSQINNDLPFVLGVSAIQDLE